MSAREEREEQERRDELRRRKEWDIVIEEHLKLVKCHKCPLWSICVHSQWLTAYRLQDSIEVVDSGWRWRGNNPPYQDTIDEANEKIAVLRKATDDCVLLRTIRE